MAVIKINGIDIIDKVSSYSINRQDVTKDYEMSNGDITSYIIRRGRFTIDMRISCDGAFYNTLETLFANDELLIEFTYANTIHNAYMKKRSYKSDCDTLNGQEHWTITLSLIESRRE